NDSGHMLLGKQIIDGKSYEFNGSGQLISDTGDISLSESTYIATGEVIDVQTILNVRKGPGTNYDSIGKLNQGDKVSIVAKNGEWYKISSPIAGYVDKKFIKVKSVENTMANSYNSDICEKRIVSDVETVLNIRKEANINSSIIGKLNKNDIVTVVEKNGEWYKILYEDDFGYAYYKYLKRFDISNKDNFISEKIQIGSIEISEKELINGNVYASINQMLRGFSNNNGYIKAVSGDIIISIQNFHEKREVSKTLPFSKCKHINGEYYYDLDEFINILGYHKYTNYIYDNNDVLYKYVNIGKSDEVEFTIHEYLDILGFVPVVGDALDAINSVIYVFEGDYVNSLLSLGAVVPIYGSAFVKGGKIGFKITKAFSKNSDKAKKAAKLLEVKDSDFILKNIDKVTLDKISQKTVTRVYKVGDKTLNEKQFAALRASAVNKAWKQEVILVEKTGRGTRAWTESEIKELLKNKKVKGYEGHHMKSAKEFPEYAGDPDNIQFLKGRFSDINNHIDAHNGSYRNPTNGYFDPETGVRIDFGDYVPGRD
ncbi:SH3 domain-containing protein, partial [Clostridium perfringens]